MRIRKQPLGDRNICGKKVEARRKEIEDLGLPAKGGNGHFARHQIPGCIEQLDFVTVFHNANPRKSHKIKSFSLKLRS